MRQWRYSSVGDVEVARTVGTGPLSIGAHFHDTVQVTIVTSGRRAFRTRTGVVQAHAGTAILIPASLPHAAFPLAEDDDSVNVYLPPDALAGVLGDNPVSVPSPSGAERLTPHQLTSALRAVLAGVPASRAEPVPTALAAAVMGTRADLGTLAARFAVSREAVIRRFTRETGLTPHAFRVVARLNVARRLLRDGIAPAEAAAEAGFADQSHLGRRFRAAFGTTPGQYRGQASGSQDITFVPDNLR